MLYSWDYQKAYILVHIFIYSSACVHMLQYSCLENPIEEYRSLVGYSPCHCKRVGHDLATKQQEKLLHNMCCFLPYNMNQPKVYIYLLPFETPSHLPYPNLQVITEYWVEVNSVKSLSQVQLFVIPWTAACQVSLSITKSWSLLKLKSIESVMPSNYLILSHPLLFLPSVFPSIRVFYSESVLHIRWPKDWSFSFSISPSNEYSGLISFRMDWLDLFSVQETLQSLFQHHSLKASVLLTQPFIWPSSHICT